MPLVPGTRLGPYEVLASLGAGGMSEVYRARDSRLHREVAIKVVGEGLAGDMGVLSPLEQEARLAGSLNHPNIVAVHDIGVHEGAPYVVTELLQGETLRERLARGPVALSKALEWAVQMAHALAAAHAHGIVHRDLKPENVFITRTGQLKLLDFGIAKATARVTEPRGLLDPTMSPAGSATRTGAVLGTPGYMSPEQVRGQHADARSDIFALGVVLHELLSGQRAFPAGSIVESGYSILHDEPSLLPPSVPAGIAQVVQHCLAKDAEARFQSARDVAFSLEALRRTDPATPATPLAVQRSPGRRLLRTPWPALGALLVLAAFAGGRALRSSPGQPVLRQLTFHRGAVWAARFAPDGKTVHLSASRRGESPESFESGAGASPNLLLVLQDVDQQAPTQLGPGQALDLSGDGRWALVVDSAGTAAGLRLLPTGPGEPRPLTFPGLTRVFTGAMFRDENRVALLGLRGTEGNHLFVLDRESGQIRTISPPLSPTFNIAVSPDQRWVASNEGDGTLTLFPVAEGKPDRITELGLDHYLVGWLEDGSLLALQRFTVPAVVDRFEPRTRKVSRYATLTPPDLTGAQRVIKAVVTHDGRTFAFHYRYRSDVLFTMILEQDGP